MLDIQDSNARAYMAASIFQIFLLVLASGVFFVWDVSYEKKYPTSHGSAIVSLLRLLVDSLNPFKKGRFNSLLGKRGKLNWIHRYSARINFLWVIVATALFGTRAWEYWLPLTKSFTVIVFFISTVTFAVQSFIKTNPQP
jgi:hypothetical protein